MGPQLLPLATARETSPGILTFDLYFQITGLHRKGAGFLVVRPKDALPALWRVFAGEDMRRFLIVYSIQLFQLTIHINAGFRQETALVGGGMKNLCEDSNL
jgi:hypothetical protein